MELKVKHLSVTFPSDWGPVRVLRDVSISFAAGNITAVVGESGSGKSILGAAIMGFLPAETDISGEVLYKGKNLRTLSEKEMNHFRGQEISWIAQDPVTAMDPLWKVGNQVTEALRLFKRGNRADIVKKGLRRLSSFGLSDGNRIFSSYPHELSGGMAQRVMGAMMTMEDPSFLIADEPTKGLDAFARHQVADMFCQLRDQGTGIFLITHDLRLARRISDYTAVMYAGELLEIGKTADIFSQPCHPYTKGLLAAQPDRGLHPMRGKPPDLTKLGRGCIFGARCPLYDAAHCVKMISMVKTGEEHFVKCVKGV